MLSRKPRAGQKYTAPHQSLRFNWFLVYCAVSKFSLLSVQGEVQFVPRRNRTTKTTYPSLLSPLIPFISLSP